jgi:hypothetical protein
VIDKEESLCIRKFLASSGEYPDMQKLKGCGGFLKIVLPLKNLIHYSQIKNQISMKKSITTLFLLTIMIAFSQSGTIGSERRPRGVE